MKLEDYRAEYYNFSSKASDVSRQLSFAGIALIWIFKPEKGELLSIPPDLLWPAELFAIALALDLMHYLIGTIIWGMFARYHEWKGKNDEDELDAPVYFNIPTIVCFWAKLFAVIAAYALVLVYVYTLLKLKAG